MAIDTPKQVNATLTSVNTPSPSFMSDASLDEKNAAGGRSKTYVAGWSLTIRHSLH